jgi:hypothetical protein
MIISTLSHVINIYENGIYSITATKKNPILSRLTPLLQKKALTGTSAAVINCRLKEQR